MDPLWMLTAQIQTNHYYFISVGNVPGHCERFLLATDFNVEVLQKYLSQFHCKYNVHT